jgi:hypothetical protein
VAAPVSRARRPSGKAMLHVYLPAELRDRLARHAFERGEPVSAVVERAVRATLEAAEAPPPEHEVPRARWVDVGRSGWAAEAPCPADRARGALLWVLPVEGGWKWRVEVAGAAVDAEAALRSRTAAMLEAEAQAASLTPEDAAAARRRSRAPRPPRRAGG